MWLKYWLPFSSSIKKCYYPRKKVRAQVSVSSTENKGWEKLSDEKNPEEGPLPESGINSFDFGLLKLTLLSFLSPYVC